jgi:antitoxin (DNA-binding transcriptional repressor) of toxin-antitoxin stability system
MGLGEANRRFSRLGTAVKAGREIVLTERGKPMAVVKPIREASAIEGALKQLEVLGLLMTMGRDRFNWDLLEVDRQVSEHGKEFVRGGGCERWTPCTRHQPRRSRAIHACGPPSRPQMPKSATLECGSGSR